MATSTPVKYSNLTFPRNPGGPGGHHQRHAASVSPSPAGGGGYDAHGYPNGGAGGDPLYGYAQSEPPTSGIYGTLVRPGGSGRNGAPPAIPPKPSLSALLGIGNGAGVHPGGGSPLLADDGGGGNLRRSGSADNVGHAGLTVRNVSQV